MLDISAPTNQRWATQMVSMHINAALGSLMSEAIHKGIQVKTTINVDPDRFVNTVALSVCRDGKDTTIGEVDLRGALPHVDMKDLIANTRAYLLLIL